MKIAFATEDGSLVNAHFGHAARFDVYEVNQEHFILTESRSKNFDAVDDKIQARIDEISDCKIVFVSEIGGGAAARVTNARIHPIKVTSEKSILELVSQFKETLSRTPAPWLRRILMEEQQTN